MIPFIEKERRLVEKSWKGKSRIGIGPKLKGLRNVYVAVLNSPNSWGREWQVCG